MITRGIRELVARDWDAARRNKERYWGERIGRPKDVDDARALWQLHHREVDAQRIRQVLRLPEEALSRVQERFIAAAVLSAPGDVR